MRYKMKKVIKQILESIEIEPDKWAPCNYYTGWDSIKKDGVMVGGMGNTRFLSVINVKIDDNSFEINFIDKYYLEIALLKWYKSCDISKLQSKPEPA